MKTKNINPYQSDKPMTKEHEYCLNIKYYGEKVDEFRRVEWKILNAIQIVPKKNNDETWNDELVELCEYIRELLPLDN